jgi:hypothetical protein
MVEAKTFNNCLVFERIFWRRQEKTFVNVPKRSGFGTPASISEVARL